MAFCYNPHMAYRKRRPKKVDPNTTILVLAAAGALAATSILGPAANRIIASATVFVVIVGLGMAAALSWLIYRGVTLRRRRQQAVTHQNVDHMTWREFEFFVMDLLRTRGFKIKDHPSGAHDQGADIIATIGRDAYVVQVKHYTRKLDNTPVQEAVAAKVQ
jgi:HJR/Mrr/RecB family endonuclease